MKTRTLFKLLIIVILFIFPLFTFADSTASLPGGGSSQNTNPDKYQYKLLAPLPGLVGDRVNIANGLGSYLNNLYTAGIAIATGLAVLMIVIGGIQYVSSDAIGGKSDGKQRIQDAIIGLLLAFMSYLLLNTLNPDLLNNDLKLEETGVSNVSLKSSGNVGGMVNVPNTPQNPSAQTNNRTETTLPVNGGGSNRPNELPLPSGEGDINNQPNPLLPPPNFETSPGTLP
jgi:hypothetical protein